MLWASLCCFMGFPGAEEPVLGIYGAVSSLLLQLLLCLALPCHHQLVVPIPNAVPPNEVVAPAHSWFPFLLPRGSSLRLSIHRCPKEASSCLPGQVGHWAVPPQCCACSAPVSNLGPVSCSAHGHLPIRLEGAPQSGDPISIPVPYRSLCFAACLAASQCCAGRAAPPVQPSPGFAACATGHGSAHRDHVGCGELTCCRTSALLCSPSRLQGPVCPCTPCLHSSQQTERFQPLSAGMGTVLHLPWQDANPASILQGVKLELSLQSSCPSYRICVSEPRFFAMRLFALQWVSAPGADLKASRNLFCHLVWFFFFIPSSELRRRGQTWLVSQQQLLQFCF